MSTATEAKTNDEKGLILNFNVDSESEFLRKLEVSL